VANFSEMFIQAANDQNAKTDAVTSGMEAGARLAQLQQAKQQHADNLKAKMEELKLAKWEKVGKLYETYEKLPEGPGKKAFGTKLIPANLDVMGMSQDMNPAVADIMKTDPTYGSFLVSKAAKGLVTNAEIAAAMNDVDKFQTLITKLGIQDWEAEKLLGSAVKAGPEIAKAEEQYDDRRSNEKANALRAGQTNDREDRIKDNQFRTYGASLNDDVTNNMKKYMTAKQALDTAESGISQLEAQLKAKKPLNPNLANAVARSIAKAYNSGAMTDRDVNDFQSRPGFEGFSEAKLNKWITGSVDMELMGNLRDVVSTSRKSMMASGRTTYKGLEGRLQAYPDRLDELNKISGLDTYKKVFSGGIEVDGTPYDIDKAEAIAKANPNHPKSIKILEAIKKARGQ
jgi:hypothetical protein